MSSQNTTTTSIRMVRLASTVLVAALAFSPLAFGQDQGKQQPQKKSNSDKLDISDIEKKYWAPKDTDFSVVQNRTYTKAKRFGLTGSYGSLLNDDYSTAYEIGAIGNYYFSERYGVQVDYFKTNSVPNKATNTFNNSQGVHADYGAETGFYGASFNWVPIYAKMSLLGVKILYFDMAFSPGIGMTQYEQQILTGNKTQNSFTYTFDVTQHFFLSRNWALRLDYQNRWFTEKRVRYGTDATNAGQDVSTDLTHISILLVGVTFYF